MPLGPIPPFTVEHVKLCREGLRALSDARDKITKAEACGVDCSQDKAIAEALQQSLEAFQREWCEPPVGTPRKETANG